MSSGSGADGALNPALAQRLVDQVAASVAHNVNLMDSEGVIIASLDRDRVGSTHWAAARAAAERVAVRVHPHEARDDVRAGVNAPLIVDGAVLGVVGVTGDPAEVDEVATLLLLALRLILDAESEQDARTARDAIARDLIAGLAAGSLGEGELAARSAAAGGMLAAPYRVVVAVDPRSLRDAASGPATAPAAAARLLRAARAVGVGLAVVDLDGLWLVVGGASEERVDAFRVRAREAEASILDSGLLPTAAALSDAVRRLRALLTAPALVPAGGAELAELEAEAVVASMPSAARRELIDRTLGRLTPRERETLRAVVAASGSVSRAAAQLGLHRNSVAARIERIEARAGWSITDTGAIPRIALALLADRAEARTSP
ncbi:carbohydrate diacid regulator [Microcella putealis]|uniref:Carbohydrate diacid regulator n=1 Tax=Microcella putealis TaxID=337005 RepID=A0A4Q7LZY1_9MICO|nr:sugar diacid recognition domain-containing protein [Microcella putealis]RZS59668.1 carbohydrate diacid regulator [Microcella putealis]TQM26781.1 carbohydrate diacid regulator [Microcella putealis]